MNADPPSALRWEKTTKQREIVLLDAFGKNPERFVNKIPEPMKLPEAVWINPSSTENQNSVL